MPSALASDNHAQAIGGRAAVASATCPCCDGCPLWRRLLQCQPVATECLEVPPPPMERWICDVGLQCPVGSVLFINNRCFRVMPETHPNPPEPSRIPPGNYPCLSDCQDPLCVEVAVLYYPARFCGGEFGAIWVCGAPPECVIHGCLIVDGRQPGIPYEQIPDVPGRQILRYQDLGPRVQTCCDNDCASCLERDLLGYAGYDDPDTCYPGQQSVCCCHIGDDGEPTTRMVVTTHRTHQRLVDTSGDPAGNGEIDITATDPCNFIVHLRQRGFGGPDIDLDGIGSEMTSCGFRCPGGWAPPFPRLYFVNGVYRIVGNELTQFGRDCEGYPPQPNGEQLEVLTFSTTFSCRSVNHIAIYRYTTPVAGGFVQTITTTFQFSAIIEGENRCTDCDGGNGVIGQSGGIVLPSDDVRRLILPAA